jgi:hypothetical protein
MQVRQRVEKLERRGPAETDALVVVGEPTPAQQAAIDSGSVRIVIWVPDNGRDDNGRDR